MAGSPLLGRVRNRAERARQHRWRMAPAPLGRTAHRHGRRSAQRHDAAAPAPRPAPGHLCRGGDEALRAGRLQPGLAAPSPTPSRTTSCEAMRGAAASQAGLHRRLRGPGARRQPAEPRWAEKTPQNIRHLDWILERFPEASVVHVIRDGRDVVCSMREHPDWRWVDGAWLKVLVTRPLGLVRASAGWRTPRRAWRGAGTAATWRSATRTSWPTRRSRCAPSASTSVRPGRCSAWLARGRRPRARDG